MKEFLRHFHVDNFQFKYRESIKNHYNIGQYWVEVELDDVTNYDEELADILSKHPTEVLPLFEEAAREVADEVTKPREGEEVVQEMQVMISSGAHTVPLRDLKSEYISRLVKVPGIVIAASSTRAKATVISLQCRGCREVRANLPINTGLEGFLLPRKCSTDQAGW